MILYSDFVQRILLQPGKLTRLIPGDVGDYEQLFRVREATDLDLAGGRQGINESILPLLRGALFYWLDALQEAEKWVEADQTVAGKYWFGMVQRRQGNFELARNVFRNVGPHAAYTELQARAAVISQDVARQPDWDPWLFVGLCEQHRFGATELDTMLLDLQQLEFEIMLNDLWRRLVPSSKFARPL